MTTFDVIAPRSVRVLGIDLARRSWRDIGSTILSFTTGDESVWDACHIDAISWPDLPMSPDTIADTIDHFTLATGCAAVSIDGPQGWRDPYVTSRAGVGRWCEYEARTPGKTGTFGVVYPRTYAPWVILSIAVFRSLLERPYVTLINDSELRSLAPPSTGQYYLLECFPTSTWRTSNLTPLPGHQKAPPAVVEAHAQTLQERFGLPATVITGEHDHLQAVVAALPAAALLDGPCEAISRGESARDESATRDIPAHRVEGLIWDARPRQSTGSPEFETRIPSSRRSIPTQSAPTLPVQPSFPLSRQCLCGCGGLPKAGRFLPGHDAKLKSALLRWIRDGDESARDALCRMGWGHFEPA